MRKLRVVFTTVGGAMPALLAAFVTADACGGEIEETQGDADAAWLDLGAIEDQRLAIAEDVHRVTSHPLIGDRARVGGFLYDVDTGLLEQVA